MATYGKAYGMLGYNAAYDLNYDKIINLLDFSIFSSKAVNGVLEWPPRPPTPIKPMPPTAPPAGQFYFLMQLSGQMPKRVGAAPVTGGTFSQISGNWFWTAPPGTIMRQWSGNYVPDEPEGPAVNPYVGTPSYGGYSYYGSNYGGYGGYGPGYGSSYGGNSFGGYGSGMWGWGYWDDVAASIVSDHLYNIFLMNRLWADSQRLNMIAWAIRITNTMNILEVTQSVTVNRIQHQDRAWQQLDRYIRGY